LFGWPSNFCDRHDVEGAVNATANSNRCVLGKNSAIGTIKCMGRESVIDAVMIVVVAMEIYNRGAKI